jgi:hypothetical protein
MELRHELQQIDDAIRSLERMGSGNRLRPIGPPKRLSAVEPPKNRQKIRSKSARTMSAV